ncbi:hypothetical protein M011DRAFT_479192 [Sporormia fimetaria CBS 119925]|uniref:Post-SET domain-containing protein n=1 Tax=Sporormia fimetaria CBS 119925 TaxID=1340428 RepID=A0A6A6V895_9PLEO|nr:hypothetical protein M011DRAFT_479192 [Sporormia fimetaria CBS 119925]
MSPNATQQNGSSDTIPAWVGPDLPRLMKVEHRPGAFAARSISLVDLPAGAIFARINTPTPAKCAYSSVQASRTLHIELNSDLVYINHSCKPTLIFDMARWEVRVNPDLEGGLKEGDELTFFYPSSEWHMAQPFDCLCKQEECRGRISGAKDMEAEVMRKYWLNEHIEELLRESGVELKNGCSVAVRSIYHSSVD